MNKKIFASLSLLALLGSLAGFSTLHGAAPMPSQQPKAMVAGGGVETHGSGGGNGGGKGHRSSAFRLIADGGVETHGSGGGDGKGHRSLHQA